MASRVLLRVVSRRVPPTQPAHTRLAVKHNVTRCLSSNASSGEHGVVSDVIAQVTGKIENNREERLHALNDQSEAVPEPRNIHAEQLEREIDLEAITTPEELHKAMALASAASDWAKVVTIFQEGLLDDEPDQITLQLAIAAYAHLGHYHQALVLLQTMMLDGMQPSTTSFDYVIDVLQVFAQTNKLSLLLDQMQKFGATPSSLSFKTVIVAYAQQKQYEKLIKIFRTYRQAYKNEHPDIDTLNVVLLACLQTGDVAQGVKVADMIPQGQANEGTSKLIERLRFMEKQLHDDPGDISQQNTASAS